MTIAIVIGTHGWAAEQLLKTAEMLLGEQENVGWIDFVHGENAETLIEKYNAQLAKLDTAKGVLFLVDTWGGSPFNAASRIVVDKEHYEVIAGVNIPMLVETLMARDDNPSFDELVAPGGGNRSRRREGPESEAGGKGRPCSGSGCCTESGCAAETNGSKRLHGYRACAYR